MQLSPFSSFSLFCHIFLPFFSLSILSSSHSFLSFTIYLFTWVHHLIISSVLFFIIQLNFSFLFFLFYRKLPLNSISLAPVFSFTSLSSPLSHLCILFMCFLPLSSSLAPLMSLFEQVLFSLSLCLLLSFNTSNSKGQAVIFFIFYMLCDKCFARSPSKAKEFLFCLTVLSTCSSSGVCYMFILSTIIIYLSLSLPVSFLPVLSQ